MTTLDAYEARDLSRVAELHHQLRGPVRPRFVRDLLRVALDAERVYVVGGEPQLLEGRSVAWLINELVPLLDGTRTVGDVAAACPALAPTDLQDALLLLHMHGMLEEGEDDNERGADAATPESETFFTRYLRRTGRRRSGRAAQAALEAAHIAIVGDASLAATLATSLREVRVIRIDVGGDLDTTAIEGRDLIVALGTPDTLERASRRCLEARVPLLAVDPLTWTIGPLTIPRASACYLCMLLQLEPRPPAPDIASPPLRWLWQQALVGRVAQHVVAFATGITPVLPLEHIEVWRPVERQTALHRFITKLPGCPLCGAAGSPPTMTLPSGHTETRARVFHAGTVVQPWHLQQPAGMQQHITPHVQRLQTALVSQAASAPESGGESLAAATVVTALARPAAAALTGAPTTAPPAVVDIDAMRALLFHSFGGRVDRRNGAMTLRLHTASAGNLASAEAFLACHAVGGLRPGIYRYVLATNDLQPVGPASAAAAILAVAHAGAVESAPRPPRAFDAVLVIASAVARSCAKYLARGYTYTLLDAGVMTHRVELTAQELHLSATSVWQFDDAAVAAALAVDGIDVCPQMLVGLGTPDDAGARS